MLDRAMNGGEYAVTRSIISIQRRSTWLSKIKRKSNEGEFFLFLLRQEESNQGSYFDDYYVFSKLPLPSSVLYARVSIATGTVELALQTWLRESRGVIILVIDVIFLIIIRLIFDRSANISFWRKYSRVVCELRKVWFFFFNL